MFFYLDQFKFVFLLWKTRAASHSILVAFLCAGSQLSFSQEFVATDTFRLYGDVSVTIDKPSHIRPRRETVIIFYALPNGNSTAWTMGKRMQAGDDWHFDIQHIRAQTVFIREKDKRKNYVVVYLENDQKSWPAWKQAHPNFRELIPRIIQMTTQRVNAKFFSVHLNGHSGGGSFIFGYLAAHDLLPPEITRISFLDSNYGYDSGYFPQLVKWFQRKPMPHLNVFAYNDSIALLNGKPFVSPTGGTWYRSHLMLRHFQSLMQFDRRETESLVLFRNYQQNIQFFFRKNPDRGIYHTQQVELNGFIHSVFAGTKFENRGYRYYGPRAYEKFIE